MSNSSNRTSRFTLMRHGSVAGRPALYGHTNVVLSDKGLSDMHKAAELVDLDDNIDKIISSPMLRCATFAERYSEMYNIKNQLDPRITEMDFGRWDGLPYDRLKHHWSKLEAFWANPYKVTPPEGERLKQFGKRVISFWRETMEANQGEHYLIVTHGGVIRIILANILDIDWRNANWFSNLKIDYASLSKIEIGVHEQAKPVIKMIGSHASGFIKESD